MSSNRTGLLVADVAIVCEFQGGQALSRGWGPGGHWPRVGQERQGVTTILARKYDPALTCDCVYRHTCIVKNTYCI